MAAHHDYYVYVMFRRNPRLESFYVGMGRGYRWTKHEEEVRTNAPRRDTNEHKKSIIRRMLDHDQDIPVVMVAEDLTREQAIEIEVALIAAIGRRPHGSLVNRTHGNDAGTIEKTEAHCQAIARALMGKKHTPERIAKMAASLRGKKQSAETRAKRSAALKGRPKPPGFAEAVGQRRKGQKHTAESRAKMSATLKSRNHPNHWIGRKHTHEARAKMSATKQALRRLRAKSNGNDSSDTQI